MTSLPIVLISFVACLLALVLTSRLAPRWHLLDHPGGRKDHQLAKPLVDGISIAVVLILSLAL